MADLVSLMAYLQHGPPSLPIIEPEQSPQNTHNDGYSADDIETVGHWQGFSLASLLQQYGGLLATVQIMDEPFQRSPPRPINSERALRSRIDAYLTNRIIRALRQGFAYMSSTRPLAGFFTVLNFDVGAMAATSDDDSPHFAFFDPNLDAQTRPNRVPGGAKPSYEWSLDFRNHPNPQFRREFFQALSQANFYMKQHHTRYSFIITDREFVAIRRLDRDGNLELSTSIPWTARGSSSQPRMTVLLAIWYLGMLAADDQNWYLA